MESLKFILLTLFLFSCDSSYDEPNNESCPRHEFMCNGECIFIDEIIQQNLDCSIVKKNEE